MAGFASFVNDNPRYAVNVRIAVLVRGMELCAPVVWVFLAEELQPLQVFHVLVVERARELAKILCLLLEC